jgi:hypothetical protein
METRIGTVVKFKLFKQMLFSHCSFNDTLFEFSNPRVSNFNVGHPVVH